MATLSPRISISCFSVMASTFSPESHISPPFIRPWGSGTKFKMDKAVVVLPAPVSPTSPSVLPGAITMSMPFTADTTSSSLTY
jgi:hypothetical protein